MISTARCGSSFRSCLRNRRFHRPSWPKTHLEKLGIGLSPDLTIIGSLNFYVMLKTEQKIYKGHLAMDL
jgi:hypothetical protein